MEVGCGDDSRADVDVELDGTRLIGGGANAFFFPANAGGMGAATGGGDAVLFAVELRKEVKRFLVEETSTSPNF